MTSIRRLCRTEKILCPWFLHDSETGYCVHYATAATILLRCLGVPARYVTGYYTDVYENEWTTVTSDDAHAWVEIYLNGIGWLRDDPTPAADTPAQTAPEEPIAAPIEPADNQPEDTPPAGDEPPAVPDTPAESQETPQETNKKPVSILCFVWPVLALAAALFLWRALRFSVRMAAIGKGSSNRRAVALYHHICWLARQTKTEVPSDFLEIAEKARFGHHKLNREDLLPMQAHAEQLTDAAARRQALLETGPVSRDLCTWISIERFPMEYSWFMRFSSGEAGTLTMQASRRNVGSHAIPSAF